MKYLLLLLLLSFIGCGTLYGPDEEVSGNLVCYDKVAYTKWYSRDCHPDGTPENVMNVFWFYPDSFIMDSYTFSEGDQGGYHYDIYRVHLYGYIPESYDTMFTEGSKNLYGVIDMNEKIGTFDDTKSYPTGYYNHQEQISYIVQSGETAFKDRQVISHFKYKYTVLSKDLGPYLDGDGESFLYTNVKQKLMNGDAPVFDWAVYQDIFIWAIEDEYLQMGWVVENKDVQEYYTFYKEPEIDINYGPYWVERK